MVHGGEVTSEHFRSSNSNNSCCYYSLGKCNSVCYINASYFLRFTCIHYHTYVDTTLLGVVTADAQAE